MSQFQLKSKSKHASFNKYPGPYSLDIIKSLGIFKEKSSVI